MEEIMVEAIEEGRIVKVSEQYAKREGLLILKKAQIQTQPPLQPSYMLDKKQREREKSERLEKIKPLDNYMRIKPDWREKQVISELIENFHWQIRFSRRRLGYSRKQVARMINISEEELQVLESGRLPSNDFVLLNKVQKFFNINLRKDGKQFDVSYEELMQKASQDQKAKQKPKVEDYKDVVGKDIEIMDYE